MEFGSKSTIKHEEEEEGIIMVHLCSLHLSLFW